MNPTSKNFLALSGTDIARRIIGFITVTYIIRHVGISAFGAISIGFTVLSYALVVSTSGLNVFGVREIARGASLTIVPKLISLRVVMSVVCCLATLLIAWWWVPNPQSARLIMIFSVSLIANAILIDWFFQGKEEMAIVGIVRVVSAIVYMIVVLLSVHSSESILWAGVGAVMGDFIAACGMLLYYYKRYGTRTMDATMKGWGAIINQSFPLGVGSILTSVGTNFPPIIIGILLTNTEVGIYNAANRFVLFLLMLDRVISILLLPISARIHKRSDEQLSSALNTALRWIVIAALPITVGGTLLGERILPIIFGALYGSSAVIFQVLIWYLFFTMVHTVYTSGLIAIGKEKLYSRNMVISVAVNIGSIALCTKLFGIIGTAAAVVGSEAITLMLMRQSFHQFMQTAAPRSLGYIVLACVFMVLVVLYMPSHHVFLTIVVGGTVYFATLMLFKVLTMKDFTSLLHRSL